MPGRTASDGRIRILLADDHAILRLSLREFLAREQGFEIVGEAGTGAETLALADSLDPDVLVLDVAMPDLSGIEVTRRVHDAHPRIRVLALTGHGDRPTVQQMVRAGAVGYVVKTGTGPELVSAIRAVASGQSYLSPEVTSSLLADIREPQRQAGSDVLGRRELQVLRLVAEGERTAEIAERLHISHATVETHRRNIMRKLDLHTAAALTKFAIREGLIEP